MKKNVLIFFVAGLLLTVSALGSITLTNGYWETTYDCAEWTQSDGSPDCDGLADYGGWTCNGQEEQITTIANNPSGKGGKGQRHWEGDGVNVNSGSLQIEFDSAQPELWIRWYMRYEQGFTWNPLIYDKLLYIFTPDFQTNGYLAVIPEWYGSSFNLASQGPSINYRSEGNGWDEVMGGVAADGQWHYYEVHLKMDTDGNNGIGEAWIDGKRIITMYDCDFGTQPGWIRITIGSNQRSPNNGRCMAVDFDDVAISTTSYIGPIGSSSPSDTTPPTISNGQPRGILSAGTTQATISVSTDETAICRYSDQTGQSYSHMPNTFSNTGTTTHTTTISGLSDGHDYVYYIKCQDTSGNNNLDDYTISFSVSLTPICGNMQVETGEQCDDGNTITESCNYGQTSCTVCDTGCQNVAGATSYCGDGTCDADNEGCNSCAIDCGACNSAEGCPTSMPEGMIFCEDFEDGLKRWDLVTEQHTLSTEFSRSGNHSHRIDTSGVPATASINFNDSGNLFLRFHWLQHGGTNSFGKLGRLKAYGNDQTVQMELWHNTDAYSTGVHWYSSSCPSEELGWVSAAAYPENHASERDVWHSYEIFIEYNDLTESNGRFRQWIDRPTNTDFSDADNYLVTDIKDTRFKNIACNKNYGYLSLPTNTKAEGGTLYYDDVEIWDRLPGTQQIACAHAADNNPCDGIVSLSELKNYLSGWKSGQRSLYDVMSAVVAWKR